LQCQTNRREIWGCNHNFVAGSCETLVSRLPTSRLPPRWLAFEPLGQFHVSLGCYPQPSHQPVHLARRGHSQWFCLPRKGCSWWLNLCSSPPTVTPRGPEQRAVTEEAGPRLRGGLCRWHLFATAKPGGFLLLSPCRNVAFFLAVAL